MTTYRLKDESETEDPRLDRLIEFDDRSRQYPMQSVVEGKRPRSYTWRIQAPYLIDQGREGACVGFSMINELMSRPSETAFVTQQEAQEMSRKVYLEAQRIDPWPGGMYPGASPQYEGTSILAGAKTTQKMGYFSSYRWAFTMQELVLGLGYNGPAVLGLYWHESNYRPDPRGYIRPSGRIVGGHAILARAVKIAWKNDMSWEVHGWHAVDQEASRVTLRNSWGLWGDNGDCYVTVADMATWLHNNGEAVFMLERKTNPEPEESGGVS